MGMQVRRHAVGLCSSLFVKGLTCFGLVKTHLQFQVKSAQERTSNQIAPVGFKPQRQRALSIGQTRWSRGSLHQQAFNMKPSIRFSLREESVELGMGTGSYRKVVC